MAKNSPDEGKSTKMVEKQVDPSLALSTILCK